MEGLEAELRQIDLCRDEIVFRDDAMKYIKTYCLHDDVEKEKLLELESILVSGHMIKTEERVRK